MEDILLFVQEQVLLVAALAILIVAYMRHESSAGGAKLSVNQIIQALNAETAILVDLREKKEFESGHVANAMNIPYAKINDSLGKLEKHKAKQIILTDNLGQHSGGVAKTLMKAGYQVARMRGGMGEWKQDGLPLVK